MNFQANIFQLTKDTVNTTFDFSIKGTTEHEELTPQEIAKFFAGKLFKVYNAQKRIQKATGRNRFLKLSKSKALYFSFICDKFEFNTEIEESLKFRFVVGDLTESQFRTALQEVLTIVMDMNEIK